MLGDRWALLIVREAFLGIERHDEFLSRLDISRAALASRLKLLVEAGVLERDPPAAKRAVYRLTEAGRDLAGTMGAMRDWGQRWLFDGQVAR